MRLVGWQWRSGENWAEFEVGVKAHLNYLEEAGYIIRTVDGMPSRDRWQVSPLQLLAMIPDEP